MCGVVIPWKMLLGVDKVVGDTSLLYEYEMTLYGKQLILMMQTIAKIIQKQVVETEKDYWRRKEYFFFAKVRNTDYQKEIPELH